MYKVIVKIDDKVNYTVTYADNLLKGLNLLNDILYANELNLEKKGVAEVAIIKVKV